MELVLGQIPQAIYFSLFLIFTKQLKEKRLLFIALMIIGYIGLTRIFYFDVLLNITHVALVYITLKFLYKEQVRVTDVVTFFVSVWLLAFVNIIMFIAFSSFIGESFGIIANAILLILVWLLRNKLPKIEIFYNKFWNRHNEPKMIKSVSVRGGVAIMINVIFYIAYLWLLYGIYINTRG